MLNKFFINIIIFLFSTLCLYVYANEPVDIWSIDKKKDSNISEIPNIEDKNNTSESIIIQDNLITNVIFNSVN